MCLAMYLFTDKNLKQIEWIKTNPAFFIKEFSEAKEPKTFKWNRDCFNVYYLGSTNGCGCGWKPINFYEEEIERLQKINDRKNLVSELQKINLNNSWLVVCWEGDQGCELLSEQRITLNDIENPEFEFDQLRKYTF